MHRDHLYLERLRWGLVGLLLLTDPALWNSIHAVKMIGFIMYTSKGMGDFQYLNIFMS